MYPSIWQILIVLVILLLLFGHKRIRDFGKSLGEALREFKKGLESEDPPPSSSPTPPSSAEQKASNNSQESRDSGNPSSNI